MPAQVHNGDFLVPARYADDNDQVESWRSLKNRKASMWAPAMPYRKYPRHPTVPGSPDIGCGVLLRFLAA